MVMAGVVLIIKNKQKDNTLSIDGIQTMLYEQISYEDFTFGIRDDITDEEEALLMELYEKLSDAIAKKDNDAVMEVYGKLGELNLYDNSIMDSITQMNPEILSELDNGGDGIIYFGEGELPEGFEIVGDAAND